MYIWEAIKAINPDAKFKVESDSRNADSNTIDNCTITWYESTTPISKDDLKTKLAELSPLSVVQHTRADEYASIKEQLDQLYHDMTAGKLDATGEWHKAIKAVKDATPKP